MTVIERRERRDEFPVGMRVLAVDDDPTCLKVLESLLLRCQYHVTTTNQAIKALKMLRENKDQFDLVISDVHMPDMDGFKLLELVGLEMDLPVIMLSANGETQAVMKGITHGACDYLIKPVRIEELKNIWQHVLRRKKFDPRDKNNSDSGEDCDKTPRGNSEGAQGSLVNGSSDNKLNRKRKDQNEEYEEDDDNLNENDDPSGQKKPRVVWTVELHRKFVSAVNQLGLDKAVPKRILDLMNVERLTRENVASHLQKYRLYLKRLSAVTNQQVNMAAILRSRDPSYLSMGLDGYSNFNSLVGSRLPPGRSSTSSTTTFQSNGSIPRMNSFNGFGLHGFVPPRSLNNTSNPVNGIAKLSSLQNNHRQGTLIQGMPTSLELDRLQQPKAIHETNNHSFNNFSGSGIVGISHSSNSFANATKSSHILQPNHQRTQPTGSGNQSSVRIPTLSSDPFEGGIGTMSLPFNDLSSSPNDSRLGSNARGISCSNVVPNAQNQASTLITTSVIGDANSSSFECLGNSNFNWEAPKQGQLQDPCLMFSSLSDSSVPNIHINDQNSCDQRLGTGFSNRKMDGSSLQGGFGSGGSGLADIVGNAMIKPECDDIDFMDGDLGCSDLYDISLGACI